MENKSVLRISAIVLIVIVVIIQFNRYFTDLGTFLFSFSISFAGIFIALSFFGESKIFRVWKKFAFIYLPIAVVLILISPTTNMSMVGFDKELSSMWLAGIFFVTSIGVIIAKRKGN